MTSRILLTSAAVLTLIWASPARADQQKLYESVGEALQETRNTRQQLAATVDSLAKLQMTTGDLRPAFDDYVQNVEKTKADAERTRRRYEAMNSNSAAYFGGWRDTIGGISNERVKKTSLKRLTAVNKDYVKAINRLRRAGSYFTPYLSDLSDIQSALSQDLTSKGMEATKKIAKRAEKKHIKVRNELMGAIQQLEKLEANLKPTA
jgi:ABC-type transporter Mla subunit MlaD